MQTAKFIQSHASNSSISQKWVAMMSMKRDLLTVNRQNILLSVPCLSISSKSGITSNCSNCCILVEKPVKNVFYHKHNLPVNLDQYLNWLTVRSGLRSGLRAGWHESSTVTRTFAPKNPGVKVPYLRTFVPWNYRSREQNRPSNKPFSAGSGSPRPPASSGSSGTTYLLFIKPKIMHERELNCSPETGLLLAEYIISVQRD